MEYKKTGKNYAMKIANKLKLKSVRKELDILHEKLTLYRILDRNRGKSIPDTPQIDPPKKEQDFEEPQKVESEIEPKTEIQVQGEALEKDESSKITEPIKVSDQECDASQKDDQIEESKAGININLTADFLRYEAFKYSSIHLSSTFLPTISSLPLL